MRAAFTLNGVHEGDATDLIRLLRSDEAIDRQTREAMADALEKKEGIRLEFHGGYEAPLVSHLETFEHRQKVDDEFQRLTAEFEADGVPKREHKQRAYAAIIRSGLANSDRAIDMARNQGKRARKTGLRITKRNKV